MENSNRDVCLFVCLIEYLNWFFEFNIALNNQITLSNCVSAQRQPCFPSRSIGSSTEVVTKVQKLYSLSCTGFIISGLNIPVYTFTLTLTLWHSLALLLSVLEKKKISRQMLQRSFFAFHGANVSTFRGLNTGILKWLLFQSLCRQHVRYSRRV